MQRFGLLGPVSLVDNDEADAALVVDKECVIRDVVGIISFLWLGFRL